MTNLNVLTWNSTGETAHGAARLREVIYSLAPRPRNIALDELRDMRMPAIAGLIRDEAWVGFLTWHAPRGSGQLLTGLTLQGGANPDAYWFLQNSELYAKLTAPGSGNISVIAGDLNITVQEINWHIGYPDLPRVLPGWTGVSNNLDHIIGRSEPGQANPGFPVGWNFPAPGTHAILIAAVNWSGT